MKFYLFSGCREGYEFDRWLTTPGWPPYVPDLSAGKELTEPAEQLADFWAGKTTDGVSFTTLNTITLYTSIFFVFSRVIISFCVVEIDFSIMHVNKTF